MGAPDPDDLDEMADRAQVTLHRPVNIRRIIRGRTAVGLIDLAARILDEMSPF
jgi:hypothetical protein